MIIVKIAQAISMVAKYLKAGLVPMLVSSPGIGKSQAVYQVAKQYNLKVIDIRLSQCDPSDLNGFPSLQDGKARYLPMDTFPLEGDPLPVGYDGWLIFFDEATSAPKAVQAASYKIILDRMVGQCKLHKNVAMVCAGNLATDGAIVEEMSTALQSRLVHIQVEVDTEEFNTNAALNNYDHRITSYMNDMPDAVSSFDPDHTEETFACPRTWEFVDRILKSVDLKDPDMLPMLSGAVSEGVARQFLVFCDIHESLPKFDKIEANPTGIDMPAARSVLWALTGSIAYKVSKDSLAPIMQFIKRMPVEFQVVCLREMIRRKKDLLKHQAMQEWIATSGVELF